MQHDAAEGLWAHLHALSVLQAQGTYTAAAARLGVSKSVVSQRIAELEKAIGVQLVTRTTRSVRLTDAGSALTREVRGAFTQLTDSFAAARDAAGAVRGQLRLTAPVAFARQWLVPALPGFFAQYPEVRLQLDVADSLSSLSAEGYDLAVRHSFQVPDTHVAWKLCDTRSLLVASRTYLARHGEPKTPQALAGHNCLYYPRGNEQPAWTFERAQQRVTVPINGGFATNNSEALRDAALGHLGIALLPDFSAHSALAAGTLEPVLAGWALKGTFATEIHLIRPYSAHVPKAVRALVDYLRGCIPARF